MIANLPLIPGSTIAGTYRINSPEYRIAKNGNEYLRLYLEDRSGKIEAHVWYERYQATLDCFVPHNKVLIEARLRCFGDRRIVDISSAIQNDEVQNPIDLIPASLGVSSELLNRLQKILAGIELLPLTRFLQNVLAQDRFLFPFCTVKASRRHHHSYPGGLLRHSVECAETVSQMSCIGVQERALGTVAALLHDCAKTVTMANNGLARKKHTLLNHDLLTLEVLSPYLHQLDQEWEDGGLALRYLLTWNKGSFKPKVPAMAVAEAVAVADRISCGIERSEHVFTRVPGNQSIVFENGVKYCRPAYAEDAEQYEIHNEGDFGPAFQEVGF
jgi:3'-5' exoribonuclease